MNFAEKLALAEGFIDHTERKKRLGQYFSGVGLARLLASLADAISATSIIDPMGGSGDMLVGCRAVGAAPLTLSTIEIDPIASNLCSDRVPNAQCLTGSAFDPHVVAQLPTTKWDLVITNPPYVRYQSLTKAAGKANPLPSAIEIRVGLEACLERMTALDPTDKQLFRTLIRGYSGLADLAVPSWLLSAAMVAKGGRLALVVPESWLSRDYAAVVNYVLFRWFKIEHIVEDTHAVWFGSAQIKTVLVVARRVDRRPSAYDWTQTDYFAFTRLDGRAAGADGPIANLFAYDSETTEMYLLRKAREVVVTGVSSNEDLMSITRLPISSYCQNLLKTCRGKKWFKEVEGSFYKDAEACLPPAILDNWLNGRLSRRLIPLEALGVSIGQGLRTGANDFFYAAMQSRGEAYTDLLTGKISDIEKIRVPLGCAVPAIRRQSELPSGYVIRADELTSRVLDLRTVALPEDIKSGGELASSSYSPMSDSLAAFVRSASQKNLGTDLIPVYIWELSAVAPNIRTGDSSAKRPPRFWYMLPPFKRRHRPDLIIPRVIGGNIKTWLVNGAEVVVDANFSTLYVEDCGPDVFALLALLNSTWCRTALEYGGAVMGGGALKVEATHLRRLAIPEFTVLELQELAILGRKLVENGKIDEIDELIAKALFGRCVTSKEINELSNLLSEGSIRRKGLNRNII